MSSIISLVNRIAASGRRFRGVCTAGVFLLCIFCWCQKDSSTNPGPTPLICPCPQPAPIDDFDPAMRFISPNGGEVFHVGDRCTVRVTCRLKVLSSVIYINIGGSRIRQLSPPTGPMGVSLPEDSAVATVIFTVPDSFTQTGGVKVCSVSDSCLMSIMDYKTESYSDTSDCYFRIVK
jgi:hypothetical protein